MKTLQKFGGFAALTWQAMDTVASGLGNGNGEILGGLWTLLVSLAGDGAAAQQSGEDCGKTICVRLIGKSI